ncbi:MAG: hypothetical protein IJ106_10380 [Parasporobacterium sp.]|nr:hypothetical protein [Parasporobacterium sp.]
MNRRTYGVAAPEKKNAGTEDECQGINEIYEENIKLINTKRLQELLGCCYSSAVKIGTAACAKVMVGSSPRWKVSRINEYLESQCEEGAAS